MKDASVLILGQLKLAKLPGNGSPSALQSMCNAMGE